MDFAQLWPYFRVVWDFKIVTVDSNTITVGTVSLGIILFCFGYFLARFTSKKITRRLLVRFKLDEGIQATIESLSFYVLFVVFTFMAMKMANFPMSIFSILGGAFAIGIGFGSQNIVNNFISGLILMFERPIKVGDFVDVDGVYGMVGHIGFRSSHIRSFGNKHIIVPNSSLLEKNVINWTHFDKIVRVHVSVGVAYGSPTRKVKELLLRAVSEEEKVIKTREPMVLFRDFADSALLFEVYFSTKIHKLFDQEILESNLRFRIDDIFRENNICIAFPQRDLHLHSSAHPIRVEIQKES